MEVQKFWTKGKIIFLLTFILLVGSIASIIYINRSKLKKEYIKIENQLLNIAPNYIEREGIILNAGEWREISIKELTKNSYIPSAYLKDCKGYVIASSDNDDDIKFNAYVKCGNIYTTENYGKKLSSKTKNTAKTQSQKDTKKPEIKLIGKEEMNVALNSTFKDPGVVATDNIDGDVTKKVTVDGTVDTSKEGTYELTYNVKDKAGNKNSITRKVIVSAKEETTTGDINKPVISFKSDIESTICTGEKIDISQNGLYGYSAYDDVDGDITSSVKISGSTGIMNSVGSFVINYEVSDSSGNKTTETKNFNVKDCSSSSGTITKQKIIDVTGLTVTPTTMPLSVGSTGKINVYFVPSNATNKALRYTSSNPQVATVDLSGNVKALSTGTSVITITTNNGISATCTINVK